MFRRTLILAAFALTLAATAARTDEATRTISVTGHGEVAATPDIAHATLGVRTVAETARAALSENSTTMAGILDAVTASSLGHGDDGERLPRAGAERLRGRKSSARHLP
jgi:uncharacterized protein YggE